VENQLRSFARKSLPATLRRPLGSLAGKFHEKVIRPIQGLRFDLSGGQFEADGCRFTIPRDLTSMAYRSCFLDGSYEAEERELIRSFVHAEDKVIELGACLGIVSCVTNKLLRNKTKHVVVEGNPFCIPVLHRNRQLNQCGFLIENCAASNQAEVTFFLHPTYVVGGTVQRETSRPVRVPGRSLEQLENRYGPFSALIIDVEGSELEVFESSRELLQKYRLVIVELHEWAIGPEGVARSREILSDCGLRFLKRAGITEAWQRS
jgi:FkbM family methyltransferase